MISDACHRISYRFTS